MNKKELRKQYLELRKTILNRDSKSKKVTDKIIFFDKYKEAKVIALYNSLEDEVSTQYLIKHSMENNKIVVLPKVINKNEMNFYKITSLDGLERGAFGIKEPVDDEDNLVRPDGIDLMIVPGVCFDRDKNRIGFGRGYYDTYLFNENNILKIGICFDEQLLKDEYIEVEDNDIKMDVVVTDKRKI